MDTREIALRRVVTTLFTRALAVSLVLVAYAFLASVPRPPTVALGLTYGVSALCLAAYAWRLWRRAFELE